MRPPVDTQEHVNESATIQKTENTNFFFYQYIFIYIIFFYNTYFFTNITVLNVVLSQQETVSHFSRTPGHSRRDLQQPKSVAIMDYLSFNIVKS